MDRLRYRGLKQANGLRMDIGFGQSGSLRVRAGAIISVTCTGGPSEAWLTAMQSDQRNFGISALNIPDGAAEPLPNAGFDERRMAGIAAARDGNLASAQGIRIFDRGAEVHDPYVVTAKAAADLFVIAPVNEGFIESGGGGLFQVEVRQPEDKGEGTLPEPLGRIVDEWRITRGTAKAYQVKKGQFVQIIDVEGQQCSDFMAMRS